MGSSNDSSGGFDISIINKINEKIDSQLEETKEKILNQGKLVNKLKT